MMKERWCPPDPVFIKINFDAAFKTQTKESCSGLVCTNIDGQMMSSKIILNRHIPSPFATEDLACLHATQMRSDLGFRNVIIEGDVRFIIRKL